MTDKMTDRRIAEQHPRFKRFSYLATLTGIVLQLSSAGCGPKCPLGPESDLYQPCSRDSDCDCVTMSYRRFDHASYANLSCRSMTKYDGSQERMCTPQCISTLLSHYIYDPDRAPGCLVGGTAGLANPGYNPLTDYIGNSVCASPEGTGARFSSELTEPEATAGSIPYWYCIPQKGFAVAGEQREKYHTYPGEE